MKINILSMDKVKCLKHKIYMIITYIKIKVNNNNQIKVKETLSKPLLYKLPKILTFFLQLMQYIKLLQKALIQTYLQKIVKIKIKPKSQHLE